MCLGLIALFILIKTLNLTITTSDNQNEIFNQMWQDGRSYLLTLNDNERINQEALIMTKSGVYYQGRELPSLKFPSKICLAERKIFLPDSLINNLVEVLIFNEEEVASDGLIFSLHDSKVNVIFFVPQGYVPIIVICKDK